MYLFRLDLKGYINQLGNAIPILNSSNDKDRDDVREIIFELFIRFQLIFHVCRGSVGDFNGMMIPIKLNPYTTTVVVSPL